LAGRSLEALAEWYDVELTWSSNALEGNTLSRSETAIILEKGLTIGGKRLKDHLEALGHKDALGYVRALAAETRPIRETDLRELDRLVLQRVAPHDAGRYRTNQRAIAGSPFVLPSPAEIPALMGDFAHWLATAPPNAATPFSAHARLVTIHPFSDGNGRTARLLMNLLLLRGGFPPLVIAPEHRARYIVRSPRDREAAFAYSTKPRRRRFGRASVSPSRTFTPAHAIWSATGTPANTSSLCSFGPSTRARAGRTSAWRY
jgi:Fic family protein